jgi:Cu/Ag efflux protein CusF
LLPKAARRGIRSAAAPVVFLSAAALVGFSGKAAKKAHSGGACGPVRDGLAPAHGTRPRVAADIMLKLKTPHQWARDRTPEQWADHHMKVVIVLIVLGVFVSYPMGVFILDAATAARHAKSAAATAPAPAPIDGSGVVVARNDTTGTVTIQHLGVPRFSLAPGATAFRASADILKKTDVGDQVIFRLAKDGDAYVVTELQIPAFSDRTDAG